MDIDVNEPRPLTHAVCPAVHGASHFPACSAPSRAPQRTRLAREAGPRARVASLSDARRGSVPRPDEQGT